MKACKLCLPSSSSSPSSSSPTISSLLFEPSSSSLALMHSDTSVILFSSVPVPSLSPLPPITPIPPISTSCCFLRLVTDKSPHRVLFLSVCPRGSSVLLRAWILRDDRFVPAKLRFGKESGEHGVAVGVHHGFTVNIVGSVNFFVLHCPADAKIMVLSARMREGDLVEVMKCAVIDCVLPVCTVKLSPTFLILGEVGGVRIFPLRPLVKGGVGKRRDLVGRKVVDTKGGFLSKGFQNTKMKNTLPNGVIVEGFGRKNFQINDSSNGNGSTSDCKGESIVKQKTVDFSSDANGVTTLGNHAPTTKLRTMTIRQDSGDLSSIFVDFETPEIGNFNCEKIPPTSLKAVSVHALSLKKFIVLDTVGDIHLLSVQYAVLDSEVGTRTYLPSLNTSIKRIDCSISVQKLAVFPDAPLREQNIWISDARYSMYMASLADTDTGVAEKMSDGSREETTRLLATQGVFTSEKIHDIVALSSNVVLVLGQGMIKKLVWKRTFFISYPRETCLLILVLDILVNAKLVILASDIVWLQFDNLLLHFDELDKVTKILFVDLPLKS